MIRFTQQSKNLFYLNKVISVNRITGQWSRYSKECYDILKYGFEIGSIEKLLSYLSDDEDRNLISKLFENLKKIGIIETEEHIVQDPPLSRSMIYIDITNRCNLSCGHCAANAHSTDKEEDLNTDQIIELFNKVAKCNPERIVITGGEPLIRTDFEYVITHLASIYGGKLSLSSNGTLITLKNAGFICSVFDTVDLSVDGVDEQTCAKVRGQGVFGQVMNAIDVLYDAGAERISLSMVLTNENIKHLDQFKKMCKELNVLAVPRVFEPIGRGKLNKDKYQITDTVQSVITKEDKTVPKAIHFPRPHACNCGAGVDKFCIDSKGNVYPCHSLDSNFYVIANVCETKDLGYLLTNSEKAKRSFARIEAIQPENVYPCSSCDVNLFCWSCPATMMRIVNNPKELEKRCTLFRRELYKAVWDEDWV